MTATDVILAGLAALYGAGFVVMFVALITAPEGHEDSEGFHSSGENLSP